MKNVFKTYFFAFVAMSMVLGNGVFSVSLQPLANAAHAEEAEPLVQESVDKYTVCHATGDGHYNRLNIPESALSGHFDNNGTPLAGHEDDILLGVDNENVLQCPEPEPDPYPDIEMTADWNGGNDSVLIQWNEITDERLDGYKVVMSETVSHPSYPDQGYIAWITDSAVTSYVHDYNYVCGQDYHFSVTGVYDNHATKIPALNAKTLNFACEQEPEVATVIAHKIVCDSEADLPNWSGGANITSSTAQDYVDSHASCNFVPNWKFEWGTNDSLLDLNGNYVGEHNVDGWYDFDSLTDANGKAQVELTIDELSTKTWFREVLPAEYIPFSYPPGDTPGSDVSAEFWCNNDVLNYDNAEWIENISADDVYYCVAFNAEKETPEEPVCGDGVVEGQEACDDGNTVDEYCGDNAIQVGTYCNATCTAEIVLDEQCDEGDGNGSETCSLQCEIPEDPERPYAPWCSALVGMVKDFYSQDSSAHGLYNDVIDLNDDQIINLSDVALVTQLYFNGNDDVCYAQFEDPEDEYHFQCEDPEVGWCGGLVQGITDSIGGDSSDPESNYFHVFDLNDDGVINLSDVGLAAQYVADNDQVACYTEYVPPFFMCEDPGYSPYCGDGVVNQKWEQCDPNGNELMTPLVGCSEQCQYIVPQVECSDLTLAKINVDDVQNWGAGDMSSDLFLGSESYKIPSNVWFAVYWNGSYFTDSDVAGYENVEGLAVQRLEDSLRVVMHGSTTNADKEHVSGNIEFYNANVTDQRSDDAAGLPEWNGLENGFDSTGVGVYNAGNDEVWVDDGKSFYWLTTTTADDGFYTDWSIIDDCQEETPHAPWCSALLGIFKAYYNPDSSVYGVYNDVIDLNDDQVVNLSDLALVTQLYYQADDDLCYFEFENPTSQEREFYFQCEDSNVGWCDGLVQGVSDFYYDQPYVNDDLHPRYDLNDDGEINLSDLAFVTQLQAANDQVACYTYYVPPFLMCPVEKPYCGDGDVNQDTEQCDDGNNEDGDGCSAQCIIESTPPPPCIGCGPSGSSVSISNVVEVNTCDADTLSWQTSKDSITWIVYGTEAGAYTEEYKNDSYNREHTMSFDGLEPGTTYYYQLRAKDLINNTDDVSGSFTTESTEVCGDEPPVPPEEPEEGPQEVLGVKEYVCDFIRPSGSTGTDHDILEVFDFPNGTLIRGCDPEMPVYLIRDQKKWHIPSWQYLHDNYFGQRIYNVSNEVIDFYEDWTGEVLGVKTYADGTLLRGANHKIYVLVNGQKQHIHTLDELSKYAGRPIFDVSDDVLAQY